MTSERLLVVTQHIDPAHSWIEVPRALVDTLGIAASISVYSYEAADGTLFLEEDCDAPLFEEAALAAGLLIEYDEVICDHLSPIRQLPHYSRGMKD